MTGLKIFWFRCDLRLSDNPGLTAAAQSGIVLPIYIIEPQYDIGGASRWWLERSLNSLNESLNGNLNCYIGDAKEILIRLVGDLRIDEVYWNRRYEEHGIKIDSDIKLALKTMNVKCQSYNGSLLWEPWEVLKDDKSPYRVYTHFYRNGCLKKAKPRYPTASPNNLSLLKDNKNNLQISDLFTKETWHKKFNSVWDTGEIAAQKMLVEFIQNGLVGYKDNRNYPAKKSVSRLSPYLHFGEISPNQIWYAIDKPDQKLSVDADHFLSEIGWREFSYYLLYYFPFLPQQNLQIKFDKFPWQDNQVLLNAWKLGQTGYPIIDAGMRELWQTGYMHNRVRMIVGSFLVKNLLINWRRGADWFWDCLVDADLANNTASWQWVAGSGADAAPYFRIFNPVLQGQKFDSTGLYTRKFVPELQLLPDEFLFNPWEAPASVLQKAGLVLGESYPKPIVDIKISRDAALKALATLK
jgi:deoxyribodipyrimidine photo-lyase